MSKYLIYTYEHFVILVVTAEMIILLVAWIGNCFNNLLIVVLLSSNNVKHLMVLSFFLGSYTMVE